MTILPLAACRSDDGKASGGGRRLDGDQSGALHQASADGNATAK